MIELFSFHLSYADIAILALVALFIGMAKTGIHGTGMAAVPLLALVFGGKASTGLLLPILSMADLFAVWYYHRHADWSHLWKLFPWAAMGVLLGTFVGDRINDEVFKIIMGVIIIGSLGIMIWLERSKQKKNPYGHLVCCHFGYFGRFHHHGGQSGGIGNGPISALHEVAKKPVYRDGCMVFYDHQLV